ETRVRTIASEARHRVAIGDSAKRRLDVHPPDGKGGLQRPLGHLEDVLLLDKRHLQVELRELELAVGPQVLVSKAARDLVVTLESGDHQELLEELGRLRQRVETTALRPARNHEVARSHGRRLGEDRCLELEKPILTKST